jgi:hypothetical protein
MKKYSICLLGLVIALFLGCNTIKKIIGMGDDKETLQEEKSQSEKIITPPKGPVKISSKDATNWVTYSLITLTILLAARYGLKKITKKE